MVLKVHELVDEQGVALDATATTKAEVIGLAAQLLGTVGVTSDVAAVEAAFTKREEVMSTGIGGGIAIPHAQCAAVDRLAVVLIRLKTPIEFNSIDHLPVSLVVGIAGPEERGGFVRVLARISRLLSDDAFRARLMSAGRSSDVVHAIARKEEATRV